jgi:glycosyltransferase involved in cell wall biosynthesis
MTKHSISVIIPTLNMGRFLAGGIASIQRQAIQVDEIIVVDNQSTDETQKVLQGLRQADARIRVIEVQPQGPAKARNRGIEAARGDVIALLDADCFWTGDKLALQLARLDREPRVDIVAGLVTYFDALNADGLEPAQESRTGTIFDVSVSTSIFRRSVFDRVGVFDESFLYAEDWDLFFRILEAAIPIAILKVPTAYALRHPASMMAQENQRKHSDKFRAFSKSMARRRSQGGPADLPRLETFLEAPPEVVAS